MSGAISAVSVAGATAAAAGAGTAGIMGAAAAANASLAMMAVSTIGTGMSMIGAHNAGEEQKAQATNNANQLTQNANAAAGAGEIQMEEQNKRTALVESKLQADAAAGGGSATDPTVVTDLKTIAGEGRFRAMTDLYNGNSSAAAMRNQAAADMAGGQEAADAGNIKALSSGLTSASSLFGKYGTVDTSFNRPVTTQGPLPWLPTAT